MSIFMYYFVSLRVREILWIGQVLWQIRNESHVLDIILDGIVINRAILLPIESEPFDDSMVLHVCLNLHGLPFVSI